MVSKQQDQGARDQRQPQQGEPGQGHQQMQVDKASGRKDSMPKAKIGNGQGGKLGGAM